MLLMERELNPRAEFADLVRLIDRDQLGDLTIERLAGYGNHSGIPRHS